MGPPFTAMAVLLLLATAGTAVDAVLIKLDCGRSNSAEVTVNSITTSASVSCPANCKAAGGSLYGTGAYTSDSRICLAAIHAGIITNSGGKFTLYYAKGRSSYTASTKNGITSYSYGSWPSTFKFTGPALTPTIDCDKTNAYRDVVGVGNGVPYNRTKLTLACPANCLTSGGQIYGTNVYTSDSRICLAAIHAGVLKNTGGLITVYDYPGLASYRGSTLNGFVSSSYGNYGYSYRFKPVTQIKCGTTNSLNLLVNATVTTAYAVCPPNCYFAGGNIYGTKSAYKNTSQVCLAAHAAGVITANGGAIIMRYVKGLSAYIGTTANSVTSKPSSGSANAFKFL